MAKTKPSPWPKIKYNAQQDILEWDKVWTGVADWKATDPFVEAADFYLLFGLSTNAFVKFEPLKLPSAEEVDAAIKLLEVTPEQINERSEYIEKLLAEDKTIALDGIRVLAEGLFTEKVERVDGIFREYVHLAVGGELRHHPNIGNHTVSPNRRVAWSMWKLIIDEYGIDALKDAAEMFRDFGGGSFGGEPWAVAAELLHARETLTLGPTEFMCKQMFVDRVFTLEHNTGTFLNKLEWPCLRSAPYNAGIKQMPSTVLTYQASNPPDVVGLWNFASPEVQTLVKNYLDLAVDTGFDIMGKWVENTDTLVFNKGYNKVVSQAKDSGKLKMPPGGMPTAKKASKKNPSPVIVAPAPSSKWQGNNTNVAPSWWVNGQEQETPVTVQNVATATKIDNIALDGIPDGLGMKEIDIRIELGWDIANPEVVGHTTNYTMTLSEMLGKKFHIKHMIKKSNYVGMMPEFVNVTLTDWRSKEIAFHPPTIKIINVQNIVAGSTIYGAALASSVESFYAHLNQATLSESVTDEDNE